LTILIHRFAPSIYHLTLITKPLIDRLNISIMAVYLIRMVREWG
jgi:hypothetical protein